MTNGLTIVPLDDSTDERGPSFSLVEKQLSLIGHIRDVHVAAVRPGHVRGNHYHESRGELISVIFEDRWSLHWDTGADTETHDQDFSGRGAVSFVPPLGWSHAIRNDGRVDLWIFVVSDESYDPDPRRRDAIPRLIAEHGRSA